MKRNLALSLLSLMLGVAAPTLASAGTIAAATVTRGAPAQLTVAWTDPDPVDVLVSSDPAARAEQMKLISKADKDGHETVPVEPGQRLYFLLRDKSGAALRVGERSLPLMQASNFRDVGGYPAAGGKHVRWGLIYRSGGQPLLTDADVAQIRTLGLAHQVDLRSSEERALAPSRVEGVPYEAIGYSMASLVNSSAPANGEAVYRKMPLMLAPHLKLVFRDLLARDGAVAYNCSAGQDRTGFVTAMILSALGVPRETILADYHLSTTLRRPEWEMPKIDAAAHPGDVAAQMFAKYQSNPAAAKPQPLKTADGTAFLSYAFDEIESKWGSVEAYLDQEAGVSKTDIAKLQAAYLE
jgi:protein-tyrosine phosphatase